jgi:hypothetical protein
MDTEVDRGYDTSIGTRERSVMAATKVWAIVLAAVAAIGLVLLGMFLTRTESRSTGPVSSENTATRPAEP